MNELAITRFLRLNLLTAEEKDDKTEISSNVEEVN